MKTTTDYKFEVCISDRGYDHKPNRITEVPKLHFTKKTVDVDDFLNFMIEGRCYTPIFSSDSFNMSGKTDINYRYSYLVSLDIDHTQVPMKDMVDKLENKPTLAYTSCNNGKDGECKYRLVYCFDDKIDGISEYYNYVYSILVSNKLSIDDIDKRSLKASQYYNGNGTVTFDFTVTNIVYKKDDFKSFYKDYYSLSCTGIKNKDDKSIIENHTYNTPYNIHLNDTFGNYDEEFESDYWNMKMEDILSKYIDVYPNMEHTPLEIPDDDTPYIIYPTGYIEIRRWWRKRLNGKPIKIKDGEGRRRILFINGIIRRLINPQITFDNLLYNLLYELVYYHSNYGAYNIIDKKEIYKIATDVMSKDMANYERLRSKHKRFMVNPDFCIKYGLSKNEVKNIASKMIRYNKIGELYDCSKKDKENLEIMKENGLEVSLSTLKRWRKKNGIAKYKI